MRRVAFVFMVLVLAGFMGVAVNGCSKKAPPVDIPDEGMTDDPDTSTPPIKPPEDTGTIDRTPTKLEDIFFDYDRSNLRPDALNSMEKNARFLRDDAGLRVILEGHCDERGTTEYNLALGERRAQAAHDFLVRVGVDPNRLTTISYGEERPFDPGHSESAWSQNRRVHFVKR